MDVRGEEAEDRLARRGRVAPRDGALEGGGLLHPADRRRDDGALLLRFVDPFADAPEHRRARERGVRGAAQLARGNEQGDAQRAGGVEAPRQRGDLIGARADRDGPARGNGRAVRQRDRARDAPRAGEQHDLGARHLAGDLRVGAVRLHGELIAGAAGAGERPADRCDGRTRTGRGQDVAAAEHLDPRDLAEQQRAQGRSRGGRVAGAGGRDQRGRVRDAVHGLPDVAPGRGLVVDPRRDLRVRGGDPFRTPLLRSGRGRRGRVSGHGRRGRALSGGARPLGGGAAGRAAEERVGEAARRGRRARGPAAQQRPKPDSGAHPLSLSSGVPRRAASGCGTGRAAARLRVPAADAASGGSPTCAPSSWRSPSCASSSLRTSCG